MLSRIFVVDSVTLASTGTAVSTYTPWDMTTRKLPTQVVVKATGQGAYVRLSSDNSAATNADVLVQAGDHVVLSVQGRRWVSVLSAGASSTVNVGALSTGVSGDAASPTLDLSFIGTNTLNPSITFTRASSATFTGSNGLIQSATTNTPRFDYDPITLAARGLLIEEQRTNLLLYSEQFDNAIWQKTEATVTPNAVVAPNGTITGEALVTIAPAANPNVQQSISGPQTGVAMVFSFYARAGTISEVSGQLFVNSGTPVNTVSVTGSIISGPGSIDSSGASSGLIRVTGLSSTQWTRIALTGTPSATAGSLTGYIKNRLTGAAVGDTSYIWGAQLEAGAFPSSYIPSTQTFTGRTSTGTFIGSNGLIQTASAGVARLQYNPLNLSVAPFLLLEAAATNLVTYSEQFDNAAWSKTASTVTANATVAPDGATTADKLVENTATSIHSASQGFSGTSGTSYTFSLYAKAGERNWIAVQFGSAIFADATARTAYVNLSTGAIGTLSHAFAVTVSNAASGWWRVAITVTATATSAGGAVAIYLANADNSASYLGDGTSGAFIWGAQLEANTFATSYIPTVATSVARSADTSTSAQTTRSADVASVNTLSPWYNATEGTFSADFAPYLITGNGGVVSFNDGTGNNRIDLRRDGFSLVTTAGVGQASMSVAGMTANVSNRLAVGYALNNFALVRNGGSVTTDTSGTVPSGINLLQIGGLDNNPSFALNGTIRRITYYPRRLPDATLQTLTT